MFTYQPLLLKKRALRGRRLVVVDIENVVGGAVMRAGQAAWARRTIQEAASLNSCEQVVIGTSHVGVLATGLGWRGPRIVVRSGVDGADLALLDVLTEERIEERFGDLILASGDGIFADVVASLGASGINVTVVTRPDRCSRRLRLAARQVIPLEEHVTDFGGAA